MKAISTAEKLFLKNIETNTPILLAGRPDDERMVRATFLRWQCRGGTRNCIHLDGAIITGSLDLSHSEVAMPLILKRCQFRDEVSLHHAHLLYINLEESIFEHDVEAHGMTVSEDLNARGIQLKGCLTLEDAHIEKTLTLNDAILHQSSPQNVDDKCTIFADGMIVGGDANFIGLNSCGGEVRLIGAHIGGDLACCKAALSFDGECALHASRIIVDGSIFLREGFRSIGGVAFDLARIGGYFDCRDAKITANAVNDGPARHGKSLAAQGIDIKGSVKLNNSTFDGEVNFSAAKIGMEFNASGSHFYSDREALNVESAHVSSSVCLNRITATGTVRLTNLYSGHNVWCENMTLTGMPDDIDHKPYALRGDAMKVVDGFFFYSRREFPDSATNNSTSKSYKYCDPKISGCVCLSHAAIGQLNDGDCLWPADYRLDHFTYNTFGSFADTSLPQRITWVSNESGEEFHQQPYEHLAYVFRQKGLNEYVKAILIRKRDERAKVSKTNWISRIPHVLLKYIIAYGYRPYRIIWFLLGLALLGWITFAWANRLGHMVPSRDSIYANECYLSPITSRDCQGWIEITSETAVPDNYPELVPLVYAIESTIPIVHLGQTDYWRPAYDTSDALWSQAGWYFIVYQWIHIVLGWVLSTVAVAGLTGLARREI